MFVESIGLSNSSARNDILGMLSDMSPARASELDFPGGLRAFYEVEDVFVEDSSGIYGKEIFTAGSKIIILGSDIFMTISYSCCSMIPKLRPVILFRYTHKKTHYITCVHTRILKHHNTQLVRTEETPPPSNINTTQL